MPAAFQRDGYPLKWLTGPGANRILIPYPWRNERTTVSFVLPAEVLDGKIGLSGL